MNVVAKFSKVSYEQFKKDYINIFGETPNDIVREIYDKIKIPKRATKYSAGHDFYCPMEIDIKAENYVLIPTGIRCKINPDWVLNCYPRSGLGFKFGMNLINTVGIIDSDYYYSENEGHIMAKISSHKDMMLKEGDRFMQGVFTIYGSTEDDNASDIRNGGLGSSGR